jgi:GTPase SAR1 family protein
MASQPRPVYGGLKPHPVSQSESGIKLGIYGPGGIGKTTLAATVCDTELGRPALYLNMRGNPHVIKSRGDDIDVYEITKFSQVEEIAKSLQADRNCPYKSIIADNMVDGWSLDLKERYGRADNVDWTQHSASTSKVLATTTTLLDLADQVNLRLNVVLIMWETPEDREVRGKKVTRSEVAFNKALQSQIPGKVTWLGRLYITDEILFTRCLDFRPIETMQQSKFQVDPDDPLTKDIPMEIYNPSLATIIDTIKGGQPWPTKRHRQPTLAELNNAAIKAQQKK